MNVSELCGSGASPPMHIRVDDLRNAAIAELLAAHVAFCRATSPPESTHVLDLDALRSPEINFWMHTAARQRQGGVGRALLTHVVGEARTRGYRRLSLETGSMAAFAPARALYARFGFVECPPFGDYRLDPNSVFMTLELAG
jgi:putative acetyltransferase